MLIWLLCILVTIYLTIFEHPLRLQAQASIICLVIFKLVISDFMHSTHGLISLRLHEFMSLPVLSQPSDAILLPIQREYYLQH